MRKAFESDPMNFFWVILLMAPSLMAAYAIAAAPHHVPLTSGFWFLYELSRMLGHVCLVIAVGLTLWIAARKTSSMALVVTMTVMIAATMCLLWYAAHLSRDLWVQPPSF
jgi:hypothetical protein